jgi:hypothetical protein
MRRSTQGVPGDPSSRPVVAVSSGWTALQRQGIEASDPDRISFTAACYQGVLQSVGIFAKGRVALPDLRAPITCSADVLDGRRRGRIR